MIRTTSMRRQAVISPLTLSMRKGFTLIELLVATTVFIIGFTSAFGLFLAAMRFRTLTDDTIKLSLAASSIVAELGVGNPLITATPKAPSDYLGSGDLPGAPSGTATDTFYYFPGVPGAWYSVISSTDVSGDATNIDTPTLHLDVIVVMYPQGDSTAPLELADLNRRMRLIPSVTTATLTDPQKIEAIDALVKRGLATRVSAVVVRRPHWM